MPVSRKTAMRIASVNFRLKDQDEEAFLDRERELFFFLEKKPDKPPPFLVFFLFFAINKSLGQWPVCFLLIVYFNFVFIPGRFDNLRTKLWLGYSRFFRGHR